MSRAEAPTPGQQRVPCFLCCSLVAEPMPGQGGAPFKLGCNCIFVNGRTCICFASSVLSRETLRAIRDHAQETLLELAATNE